MIAIRLPDDREARERLRSFGETAERGVARAIAKLGIDLKNTVQQNKLSGQVLRARSGQLRGSISTQIEESRAAIRARVFSDARYAAAQEYGFAGRVGVRASLRRVTSAFGRPIAPITIGVGGHSRRMELPPRSFLRSSLRDMMPDIANDIEDAVREAL